MEPPFPFLPLETILHSQLASWSQLGGGHLPYPWLKKPGANRFSKQRIPESRRLSMYPLLSSLPASEAPVQNHQVSSLLTMTRTASPERQKSENAVSRDSQLNEVQRGRHFRGIHSFSFTYKKFKKRFFRNPPQTSSLLSNGYSLWDRCHNPWVSYHLCPRPRALEFWTLCPVCLSPCGFLPFAPTQLLGRFPSTDQRY